jgi:sulfur carrier protein ThiS
MKVRVKLFGTLRQHFPGYNPEQGIDVEIPDGARVRDILAHLEISESQGGIVAVRGRIMNADDKLGEWDSMHIFQPVFGG